MDKQKSLLISHLFYGYKVSGDNDRFNEDTDEVIVLIDKTTRERTYALVRPVLSFGFLKWIVLRKAGSAYIINTWISSKLDRNCWEVIAIVLRLLGYPGVYEIGSDPKHNFMYPDLIDALCPPMNIIQERFEGLSLGEKFSDGGMYDTEEFGAQAHWEEIYKLIEEGSYGKEVYCLS